MELPLGPLAREVQVEPVDFAPGVDAQAFLCASGVFAGACDHAEDRLRVRAVEGQETEDQVAVGARMSRRETPRGRRGCAVRFRPAPSRLRRPGSVRRARDRARCRANGPRSRLARGSGSSRRGFRRPGSASQALARSSSWASAAVERAAASCRTQVSLVPPP